MSRRVKKTRGERWHFQLLQPGAIGDVHPALHGPLSVLPFNRDSFRVLLILQESALIKWSSNMGVIQTANDDPISSL